MKKEKLVMNINHIIANELSVKLWQVDAAIKLIDETPFRLLQDIENR